MNSRIQIPQPTGRGRNAIRRPHPHTRRNLAELTDMNAIGAAIARGIREGA